MLKTEISHQIIDTKTVFCHIVYLCAISKYFLNAMADQMGTASLQKSKVSPLPHSMVTELILPLNFELSTGINCDV